MPNPNILRKVVLAGNVPFDVDARAFFNAVIANSGALTDLEKPAYNVYRIDAKNNAVGAWNSDGLAGYPMLGSTAESMAINAQNPGTFDITWVNTVGGDFTANGWMPNGLTSYGRTGLIPSVDLTIQSVALEYYSRTNVAESTQELSASVTVNQRISLLIRLAGNLLFDCYDNAGGHLLRTITRSDGGITVSRIANNDSRAFRSGIQLGVALATTGGTQPNIEFYLGCVNNAGSPASCSTKECAGASIFDGLSSAKVLAQYTARQLLNTNCVSGGREV